MSVLTTWPQNFDGRFNKEMVQKLKAIIGQLETQSSMETMLDWVISHEYLISRPAAEYGDVEVDLA